MMSANRLRSASNRSLHESMAWKSRVLPIGGSDQHRVSGSSMRDSANLRWPGSSRYYLIHQNAISKRKLTQICEQRLIWPTEACRVLFLLLAPGGIVSLFVVKGCHSEKVVRLSMVISVGSNVCVGYNHARILVAKSDVFAIRIYDAFTRGVCSSNVFNTPIRDEQR
jgi:hypothetical protein